MTPAVDIMGAQPNTTRGCGDTRTEGGLYMESGLVTGEGVELEFNLLDPPLPVDPQADNIRALGVELFEGPDGVVHILDWIGAEHYPYPADFLEETRRKGLSRRISRVTEIERLTPYESMVFLVHARGHVENWREYLAAERESGDMTAHRHCARCLAGDHEHVHATASESCSRYAWMAFEADAGTADCGAAGPTLRTFTDFRYRIFPQPAITPTYSPAIIARMPLTNLTVIAARDGSHQELLEDVRDRGRAFRTLLADG